HYPQRDNPECFAEAQGMFLAITNESAVPTGQMEPFSSDDWPREIGGKEDETLKALLVSFVRQSTLMGIVSVLENEANQELFTKFKVDNEKLALTVKKAFGERAKETEEGTANFNKEVKEIKSIVSQAKPGQIRNFLTEGLGARLMSLKKEVPVPKLPLSPDNLIEAVTNPDNLKSLALFGVKGLETKVAYGAASEALKDVSWECWQQPNVAERANMAVEALEKVIQAIGNAKLRKVMQSTLVPPLAQIRDGVETEAKLHSAVPDGREGLFRRRNSEQEVSELAALLKLEAKDSKKLKDFLAFSHQAFEEVEKIDAAKIIEAYDFTKKPPLKREDWLATLKADAIDPARVLKTQLPGKLSNLVGSDKPVASKYLNKVIVDDLGIEFERTLDGLSKSLSKFADHNPDKFGAEEKEQGEGMIPGWIEEFLTELTSGGLVGAVLEKVAKQQIDKAKS